MRKNRKLLNCRKIYNQWIRNKKAKNQNVYNKETYTKKTKQITIIITIRKKSKFLFQTVVGQMPMNAANSNNKIFFLKLKKKILIKMKTFTSSALLITLDNSSIKKKCKWKYFCCNKNNSCNKQQQKLQQYLRLKLLISFYLPRNEVLWK